MTLPSAMGAWKSIHQSALNHYYKLGLGRQDGSCTGPAPPPWKSHPLRARLQAAEKPCFVEEPVSLLPGGVGVRVAGKSCHAGDFVSIISGALETAGCGGNVPRSYFMGERIACPGLAQLVQIGHGKQIGKASSPNQMLKV